MGPSPEEIAWAAGLFEGEGYAGLNAAGLKRKLAAPKLAIVSTDLDVLQRWQEIMQCGNITQRRKPISPKHRPQWTLQVGRWDDILRAIDLLRPWLLPRRIAQVDKVIAAAKTPGRFAAIDRPIDCPESPSFRTVGRHRRCPEPLCKRCAHWLTDYQKRMAIARGDTKYYVQKN